MMNYPQESLWVPPRSERDIVDVAGQMTTLESLHILKRNSSVCVSVPWSSITSFPTWHRFTCSPGVGAVVLQQADDWLLTDNDLFAIRSLTRLTHLHFYGTKLPPLGTDLSRFYLFPQLRRLTISPLGDKTLASITSHCTGCALPATVRFGNR
jgi:hypothetical protein